MSERSKEHDWKSCIRQRIEGSNPSLSASFRSANFSWQASSWKRKLSAEALANEYILCHADIHGWNLIVDKDGTLYIVDWDTLILAPKERDLMFISAGIWDSGRLPAEEESLFIKGYGKTAINQDAICYYRFERIIQDIGEYCGHTFLSDEGGEDRIQSFEYLQSIFLPNGAIERAYQSDKMRKVVTVHAL